MEPSITLFIGIGVSFLGLGWAVAARKSKVLFAQEMARRKQVEGMVARMRREEGSASGDGLNPTEYSETPMVEYDVNKIRYTFPIRRKKALGDKVIVAYNPAVPSDGLLAEDNSDHAFIAGCVIALIGLVVVSLALLGHPVLD